MKLNLETNSHVDEVLKAYLEEHANETLAEKINNGVPIEKDGKRLINKKTLSGFLTFAAEEAKKQAEKGARSACVEDNIVFGWLMHYFEENSIIGTLYNEDGTEYKPTVKTKSVAKTKTAAPVITKPEPPKERQTSLFDMMTATPQKPDSEETDEDEEPTEEEIAEAYAEEENEVTPDIPPKYTPSPMYRSYLNLQEKYKDCLLFMRLGDFYEIFGESAVTAANALDLTLTGRDVGLKERIPMVGLPYHAMDNYLAKLVQKGYKVALAEDSNNPNSVHFVQGQQKIDTETGEIFSDNEEAFEPEELTEEEMRKFDGDIDDDISTVSRIAEEPESDEELEKDRALVKAFDKDALCILAELFDGELNLA